MDNTSFSTSSVDVPETLTSLLHFLAQQFHRLPGSAIFLRYVKSSYQNDPVRSALELFLVLFAIRYLLAPKYSTKPGKVVLSDEVSSLRRRNFITHGQKRQADGGYRSPRRGSLTCLII